MPGASATGLPYLTAGDQTTEIADTSQDLVDKLEAQDRTAFTTLGRDAIPAAELWVGRRIWNVTAGAHQVLTQAAPPVWRDTSQPALDAAAAAQARADAHAARHATGGPDVVTPAAIGALTQDGADGRYVLTATRGAANGVATLGSDSRIPSAQLPPLAITDTFVVATQAAMLALAAQTGDVAVRTDQSRSYILRAEPAATLGNWSELQTPADAVLSVNGETGSVSLTASEVGAAASEHDTDHDDRFVKLSGGALTGSLTIGAGGQIRPDYTPASAATAPDQYPLGVSEGSLTGGDWPTGAGNSGTHLTVRYSATRVLQIVTNTHNVATNRTEVHVRYGYDALWGPWNSLNGLSNEDFATATAVANAYPYGTTVFGVSAGAAGWPVAGTAAVQTIRTGGPGYANSCAVQHFWPRASPSRAHMRTGTETVWNAWVQL